jgi:hypothetical protein
VLTLQNYTPGNPLDVSNFVSFTYVSNVLPNFSFSPGGVYSLTGLLPASLTTTPAAANVTIGASGTVFQSFSFGYWCIGEGGCLADGGSTSSWILSGTGPASPGPPTLVSPANGASLVGGTGSTLLQWLAAAGATSYNVEVDTGSCGGQVFSGPNSTTATSFTVTGLASWTPYYWRVASVGPGGTSAFSSCFIFNVTTATVPVLSGWALALLALLLAAISAYMLLGRRPASS